VIDPRRPEDPGDVFDFGFVVVVDVVAAVVAGSVGSRIASIVVVLVRATTTPRARMTDDDTGQRHRTRDCDNNNWRTVTDDIISAREGTIVASVMDV
jgi:hypothetical protein